MGIVGVAVGGPVRQQVHVDLCEVARAVHVQPERVHRRFCAARAVRTARAAQNAAARETKEHTYVIIEGQIKVSVSPRRRKLITRA